MERDSGYQTKQKSRIIDYLAEHADRHVTAAELVQAFAAGGEPIAAATIYRQLDRLEASGQIRRFSTDERGSACWQFASEQTNCISHFHLKCTECGALFHIDCDFLRDLDAHILAHHGFTVDNSRTVLYGLCEHCKAARR